MLMSDSCSKKIPAYVSNILQSTRITYIGNNTQIHIPYRFSECNWHLPRGETCEVGPSKNCAVEDTIKYIGDEKNCQIQIERVQQDEDGNWQVNSKLPFILHILFAPVIYFSETFHSNSAI